MSSTDINIVCTTYFRSKINPQGSSYIEKDSYTYIKPWYDSVNDLKLKGVIFYDDLSKEFIDKYTTEYTSFYYYKPKKYSLNDARFYAYKNYLDSNNIDNIFMTDVSDVHIKKNPFKLINKNSIYVGSDEPNTPTFGSNSYLVGMARKAVAAGLGITKSMLEYPCCNAGVIGGHVDIIKPFLHNMCATFDFLNSEGNNNMTVLHYVLDKFHRPLEDKLVTGFPLTSAFKKYELNNEGVYFVHK
jgi:hypothetical protein